MLRERIKKLLIKLGLVLLITMSITLGAGKALSCTVYANTYNKGYTINQEINKSQKKKILIYHTHTNEDYKDTKIVNMGEDLSEKLRKKGFLVKHITKEFDKIDYNKAYHFSREMLKEELKTNTYDLIIDYHRDAINGTVTNSGISINGDNLAKVMFVQPTESPNVKYGIEKAITMGETLNKFGNINRGIWDKYKRGIVYYSQDLDKNIVLMEFGNQNNTKLEVMRTNTYVAASIEKYLNIE